jgi:hypothetical protein
MSARDDARAELDREIPDAYDDGSCGEPVIVLKASTARYLRALLDEPVPADEREALAEAVDLIDRNRAGKSREGVWADVDAALDLILHAARAGFRRQWPMEAARAVS